MNEMPPSIIFLSPNSFHITKRGLFTRIIHVLLCQYQKRKTSSVRTTVVYPADSSTVRVVCAKKSPHYQKIGTFFHGRAVKGGGHTIIKWAAERMQAEKEAHSPP